MQTKSPNIVVITKGVVIGSKFGWVLDGSTLVVTTTVSVTSESELVSLWIRMCAHDPSSIMIRFKTTWSNVHGCYSIGKRVNYLIVSYLSIFSVSVNAILYEW